MDNKTEMEVKRPDGGAKSEPIACSQSFSHHAEFSVKILTVLKGGVGHFGETSSSALEFENTQLEEICHFLTEPLPQHTRTRT